MALQINNAVLECADSLNKIRTTKKLKEKAKICKGKDLNGEISSEKVRKRVSYRIQAYTARPHSENLEGKNKACFAICGSC